MPNERNVAQIEGLLNQVAGLGTVRGMAEWLAKMGVLAPRSLTAEDAQAIIYGGWDGEHEPETLPLIQELERIAMGAEVPLPY